jgi:CheY-like chemotaxis protein
VSCKGTIEALFVKDPGEAAVPLIFYIDDSKDDLFYLEYIRRKGDFEADLVCFQEPQAAWQMLEEHHAQNRPMPDLVIADLYMPLDGGLELVRKMRADGRFSRLRIAICSGSDAAEDRLRSLAAGADLYLAKPLNFGDICFAQPA